MGRNIEIIKGITTGKTGNFRIFAKILKKNGSKTKHS